MRVLLSAYSCEPHRGSESGVGWNWAMTLARRGHDVEVLSHPIHEAAVRAEIETLPGPLPRFHFLPPGPLDAVPQPRLAIYAEYLAWQRQAERAARSLGRFDVVHHVSWGSLHWGTRLGRLGFPLVVGPLGGGQTALPQHAAEFGAAWRQEQVRTALTEHLLPAFPGARRLRGADHVLSTNAATTEWLHRLGVRNVTALLADGIEPALLRSAPRQPNADPVFLWAGRLMPRKAPALAVRAFARVRTRLPAARLVIVGDGPEQGAVSGLVDRLGLGGAVEITGFRPWPELLRMMDTADCFVFSSLRDSFGGQCLEAAARGLPIALLNHQGAGELLPDGATRKAAIDVPDLAVSLADAMFEVVSDSVRWRAMSQAAANWAAQQTWEAKVDAVEPIYARLAYRGSRRTGPVNEAT